MLQIKDSFGDGDNYLDNNLGFIHTFSLIRQNNLKTRQIELIDLLLVLLGVNMLGLLKL